MRIRKHGSLWKCELVDDGTLDTVVLVQDVRERWEPEEIRFSDTSDLRDKDGRLTKRGFHILCGQAVDEYSDAH